jgi:ABC-type antimicrobial peptide transport system permease subunit
VVAGAIAGLAGALAATRLLSSLLFGVKPHDPLTFIVTAALLVGTALAACWLAARRATAVDLNLALRRE